MKNKLIDIEEKDEDLKVKSHLAAYDLLKTSADWLQNPDNEIFGLLEYDNDSLNIAAKASVIAAAVLNKAAMDIQLISGISDSNKYEKNIIDAMQDLKSVANEFDESGDEHLVKKANLLDEILLTIASSVESQNELNKKFEEKIAKIKQRKKEGNLKTEKIATESKKKETEDHKNKRPLEASLQTRYCPDHPGSSLVRIRDNVWYCITCSKQFNFKEGYTTAKGNHVPATSVECQTDFAENLTIPRMIGDK